MRELLYSEKKMPA